MSKKKENTVIYTTRNTFVLMVFKILLMIWWLSGIAITAGGWKVLACVFPPYSLYKVVEYVLILQGII